MYEEKKSIAALVGSKKVNYYTKLKKLIDNGALRFIWTMSLPRACGTLFLRSLAQEKSVEGCAQEPFFPGKDKNWNRDLDDYSDELFSRGCKYLYDYYLELSKQNQEACITMCVKDIAAVFTLPEFKKIINLIPEVIFLIREPTRNLKSEVIGATNFMLSNQGGLPKEILDFMFKGGKSLLKEDFQTYLGESTGHISLEKLKKLIGTDDNDLGFKDLLTARNKIIEKVNGQFIQNWHRLSVCYAFAQQHQEQNPTFKLQLVDACELLKSPEETIKQVCEGIADFEYNNGMVHNLEKFQGDETKNFPEKTSPDKNIAAVWHDRAVFSQEIIPTDVEPLELDYFPEEMHEAIKANQALYAEFCEAKKSENKLPIAMQVTLS